MAEQIEMFGPTAQRFWCRYDQLEEYHSGMWVHVSDKAERANWLARAVGFLSDSSVFRDGMRKVFAAWPTSCRYNFSNPSLNKPVWLAHAGASLTRGIPEEFMRLGYWELSIDSRARADKDAIEIFGEWERDHHAKAIHRHRRTD
ncbi:MAG: hypothetical protein GY851_09325 [bacterium]|nr:hypothetical protein [bacterium]